LHLADLIGREEIDVEWLGGSGDINDYTPKTFVADHWIVGPHHVWKDVESQKIVRMYQPFNGLEVFDPEAWEELSETL